MTQDWRAVLLAGGRSSRMGTDKAMLPWGAGTLIAHMHALLLTAGARQVVVSGHRPEFDGVPDAQPGTGPMGALAQLAPQLQAGQWLVVPVDMPLLTVELVHALLSVDAACACVEDHPLPMALRLDAGVRAVLAGKRVRNRIKLAAAEDKGGGRWLLSLENTVEIEGSDKPALVATTLAMVFG